MPDSSARDLMVANLSINKFQYPTKALPFLTLMLILLLSNTYEERGFEMLELYTYRDAKRSKVYIHDIPFKHSSMRHSGRGGRGWWPVSEVRKPSTLTPGPLPSLPLNAKDVRGDAQDINLNI